jgi:hypothetical protein
VFFSLLSLFSLMLRGHACCFLGSLAEKESHHHATWQLIPV